MAPSPISEDRVEQSNKNGSRKRGIRKRDRLRRVGRRLLVFRRRGGGRHSSSSSSSRRKSDPHASSYGAVDETRSREGQITDDDDDDVDDSSFVSLESTDRNEDDPAWMFWRSGELDLRVISVIEMLLRWTILLTSSFILGIEFASLRATVKTVLVYSIGAWALFLVLGIGLAIYKESFGSRVVTSFDEEEGRALLMRSHGEEALPRNELLTADGSFHSTTDDSQHSLIPQRDNVHPALNPFYIIDCNKVEKVFPNAAEAYKMETDYFSGDMMVLVRTPDVDDASLASPPGNALALQHMRGKQRRFEFQFQVRLRKIPTGTVFFSCDLMQPIKLGMVQKAFVSAAMSFVRSSNPSFNYSIQGSTSKEDGSIEIPHMAFPVQDGMNRVVATPPGEEPPRLGQSIEEDAESLKRRKKGIHIEWNLTDTFTFSLWSAYVDFLEWRVMMPGIRPFSLSSVIGAQPVYLTLYEIDGDKDKHYRKDMTMIAEFEMSHSNITGDPGTMALKMESNLRGSRSREFLAGSGEDPVQAARQLSSISPSTPVRKRLRRKRLFGKKSTAKALGSPNRQAQEDEAEGSDGESSLDGEIEERAADDAAAAHVEEECSPTEEADAVAAAELGEGIYVKSGDAVTLREGNDDYPLPSVVSMGGGFAVMQDQASSVVIIEKAGRSRRGKSGRSKLIRNGDTVLFKLVTKGRKGGDEMKYLSIHRGWWLKWVATAPTNNGHFTICTNEADFDSGRSGAKTPEIRLSYLTLGGAFWLRHRRWSKFSVGVAAEGSTTYGGRMLGLFSREKGLKGKLPQEAFVSDDPAEAVIVDEPVGNQNAWLQPLLLRAFEPFITGAPALQSVPPDAQGPLEEKPEVSLYLDEKNILFSDEDYQADAPVWVEMMNRTHRVPQLAYVVRVQGFPKSMVEERSQPEAFVKIRPGRELSKVMRAGLSWSPSPLPSRMQKNLEPFTEVAHELSSICCEDGDMV